VRRKSPTPQPVPDDFALYSARQVADILNLSTTTVAAMEKRGQLIPVRIGRTVRYKRAEVDRFLASLTATADNV
jgi:excisionase family DNA binding protein